MSERVVVVTAEAPARLEAVVRRALPGASRRLARRLIADGLVRVNGRAARKGTLLAPGDEVTVPALAPLGPEPELVVPIVYEDAELAVLEKPGGMPGHALDPRQRGTVAAFVLARYPETAALGEPLAPGLVHRLDTGTSGLLVVARTPQAYAALRDAFAHREVDKQYLAVVAGRPPETLAIDLPLAHDPGDRRRMRPARPGDRAWRAVTELARLAQAERVALVGARMRTGVTHQVRAHLAAAGHPVVGDAIYGGPPATLAPGRHALHAAALRLPHPAGARPLVVTSPLPPDLHALVPGASRH